MLGRGVRPWAMQGNRKGPTKVMLVHSKYEFWYLLALVTLEK